MKIIQEKNQVQLTDPGESNEWADFRAQRHINSTPDTVESLNIPNMVKSAAAPPTMMMSHNNEMPSGYSITDQHGNNANFRMLAPAGSSDVTGHVNEQMMRDGFFSAPLSGEQYSNDRDGHFDDDVGGVVNRNNYLDR